MIWANKAGDVVLLGLQSLTVHLVRSVLTVLGILFGVWSVIAMLAINEGAARKSREELAKLGSDNLIIDSIKPPPETRGAQEQSSVHYGLTYADVDRLRDNVPNVVRCTIVYRTIKNAIVPFGKIPVSVLGTEPSYLHAARLRLSGPRSRFLTGADMLLRRNVCVVTAELARKLFGPADPIGQRLRLKGELFVVVGVAGRPARVQRVGESVAIAYQVFIPATTYRQRYGEMTWFWTRGSGSIEKVEVSQVILQMRDEDAVLVAARIVRPLLKRFHDREDYEIKIPLEEIEQMKTQARLWNYMFFAIAAVSLIVGGIGIMNIMLASVTERTREIGVRRAMGAKKRDIVVQFLVESVALTTLGGLLGIFVGAVGVPAVVRLVLNLEAIIEWPTLVVPFAMALIVGLASGIYPATRAAGLDPIVALRHE